MRLRHRADVRTLVWAFVSCPPPPSPSTRPPARGVALARLDVPRVQRGRHRAQPQSLADVRRPPGERAVREWISFFYGYPVFAWIPTHNENHHKFVNGPGDATSTLRMARDNGLARPSRSLSCRPPPRRPLIARFLARTKQRKPTGLRGRTPCRRVVVFVGHAAACGLAIGLHGSVPGRGVYASASASLPPGRSGGSCSRTTSSTSTATPRRDGGARATSSRAA